VNNEFFEYHQPTIGAAFLTKKVSVDSDHEVKFEIWDTAGQERYRSLAPMYYRGAAAALVMYDITDNQSFNGAKTWIDELHRQGASDIVIGLAGNKIDRETERKVPQDMAMQYASETGCIFMETSAKTGENINQIFTAIAKKLPKSVKQEQENITILTEPKQAKPPCCKK